MKQLIFYILQNIIVKTILVLTGMSVLAGCFWRPNCGENKYRVNKSIHTPATFKTNGIYVSKNRKGSFFLYSDGRFHNNSTGHPKGTDFWQHTQHEIKKIYDSGYFNREDGWGDYVLTGDSLFIQFFNYHTQEFCKRWVYEMKGKVLNDSTIEMFYTVSTLNNYTISNGVNIFSFYQTDIKPDSSKGWLYKKSWYKKNLHESRK